MAARGGLHRIPAAMADPDPHQVLGNVASIFCEFWSFDTPALGHLHAAGATDQEFEESVRERNERRRHLLRQVVRRMAAAREPSDKSVKELVDVLFALTSLPFFAQLASRGHTTDAACRLIQDLCRDCVRRAGLKSD
jgi:hypothetical protein